MVDKKTMQWLSWERKLLFYFIFSELKEEQKDLAHPSVLNQAGISFLSFMSGAWVSKDNCEEIVFDWSVKSSPLACLLRLWIKTSRQDSGEDRTGEKAGSYSALSGLWWHRSSWDKRAPPSKAEINTGNISLGPVPRREPWAGRESTEGNRCHKPVLAAMGKRRRPLQEELFYSYPVGVTSTPGTMRPLCCRNNRKSAASRIRHLGHMAIWSPPTWFFFFWSLLPSISICPCFMHKVHMCSHQSGHSPSSNSSPFHQSLEKLFLLPEPPFLRLCLSGSYTSFKTHLKDHFFQNALQLLSLTCLELPFPWTWILECFNGASHLCRGQSPTLFPRHSLLGRSRRM